MCVPGTPPPRVLVRGRVRPRDGRRGCPVLTGGSTSGTVRRPLSACFRRVLCDVWKEKEQTPEFLGLRVEGLARGSVLRLDVTGRVTLVSRDGPRTALGPKARSSVPIYGEEDIPVSLISPPPDVRVDVPLLQEPRPCTPRTVEARVGRCHWCLTCASSSDLGCAPTRRSSVVGWRVRGVVSFSLVVVETVRTTPGRRCRILRSGGWECRDLTHPVTPGPCPDARVPLSPKPLPPRRGASRGGFGHTPGPLDVEALPCSVPGPKVVGVVSTVSRVFLPTLCSRSGCGTPLAPYPSNLPPVGPTAVLVSVRPDFRLVTSVILPYSTPAPQGSGSRVSTVVRGGGCTHPRPSREEPWLGFWYASPGPTSGPSSVGETVPLFDPGVQSDLPPRGPPLFLVLPCPGRELPGAWVRRGTRTPPESRGPRCVPGPFRHTPTPSPTATYPMSGWRGDSPVPSGSRRLRLTGG